MRKAWAAVIAGAVLAGCSAGMDTKLANSGVADFHAKLNAQNYDAIYAAAGPQMKATTTQTALVQLLSAVHRKLGDYRSGVQAGWNDNVGTAGHLVILGHAAKYERGGATERFVYRLDGGRAELVGYNINSTALVLN